MTTMTISFRGRLTQVEYQALDPDPATGACPLDWWFMDEDLRDTAPTADEDRAIRGRLDDILCEPPAGWREGP